MIHTPDRCEGTPCPFHAPSDHHMAGWRTDLRMSGLVERLCPHGIGHPDPDSVAWLRKFREEPGIHGCDGCCHAPRVPVRVQRRRVKGWRTPLCGCGCGKPARYVGRGSKWGNPFGPLRTREALVRVPAVVHSGMPWEAEGRISADGMRHDYYHPNGEYTVCHVRYATAVEVVECYKALLYGDGRWPVDFTHEGYFFPHIKDIGELRGHDLACWCPLDRPCHADVLLEVANR